MGRDVVEGFTGVGDHAVAAVLDSVFCVFEVAAAFIAQGVQGAVTKQTIEVVGVLYLMTWEKLAVFMGEELKIFSLSFHIFYLS